MVILQPCDWHEHDVTNRKVKGYVVDVYGRTEDGMVACLRITGFNPYFYCGGSDPGGATQHRQQLLLETASGSVVSAMAVVTLLQSLLVLE